MWLWRRWRQSLLRSQWRSPLTWPVDSGPGVREFHHFHIHHSSFSFISVVATSIWPSFSCVNSSVGYLMQDLTVNFISIYAKVYMGTKNTGGRGRPKYYTSWDGGTAVSPKHKECNLQKPDRTEGMKRVHGSGWISPLSTKIHFKSSVAKRENA